MHFFCSFDLFFLFPFFISFRFDLNSAWSFFASARLILKSLILSKRLKALSNWSIFASAVLALYLYIKSSELIFFVEISYFVKSFIYNFIIIIWVFSLSWVYFLIALISPWFWIAFICLLLDLQLFLFAFQKLFPKKNK